MSNEKQISYLQGKELQIRKSITVTILIFRVILRKITPGLEQGKYKISLEHPVVEKEVLKKLMGNVERTQTST